MTPGSPLQIGDRVRYRMAPDVYNGPGLLSPGETVESRVQGFYRRDPDGFAACLPDDPLLDLVYTYETANHFLRPWDIVAHIPVRSVARLLAANRQSWLVKVARGDGGFSRASFGDLYDRFPALTAHERLRVRAWQQRLPSLANEDERAARSSAAR